eukprot:scaffold34747_cov60-Phaeocystis_antarctica.AAC.2
MANKSRSGAEPVVPRGGEGPSASSFSDGARHSDLLTRFVLARHALTDTTAGARRSRGVQWYGGGHRTRQLGLMRLSCSTVSENIMRRRRGNACTGSGGFGGLAADGAGAWRRPRSVRRPKLLSPRDNQPTSPILT